MADTRIIIPGKFVELQKLFSLIVNRRDDEARNLLKEKKYAITEQLKQIDYLTCSYILELIAMHIDGNDALEFMP